MHAATILNADCATNATHSDDNFVSVSSAIVIIRDKCFWFCPWNWPAGHFLMKKEAMMAVPFFKLSLCGCSRS